MKEQWEDQNERNNNERIKRNKRNNIGRIKMNERTMRIKMNETIMRGSKGTKETIMGGSNE
jgi:hypothetical protein